MPGVTKIRFFPIFFLTLFNSLAEQTIPSKSASFANLAKRITWSSTFPIRPNEVKSLSSILVRTETPKINGIFNEFFAQYSLTSSIVL